MKLVRSAAMLGVLLAAVVVASCTSESPTEVAVNETPSPLLGALLPSLLDCRVLPQQVDTFTVDSRGGSFAVGYASVAIPKYALSTGAARTFEMRTPADRVSSVVFTPIDGQGTMRFAKSYPARITLSYAHCSPLSVLGKIAYTTDESSASTGLPRILQLLVSKVDLLRSTVSASTDHFSRYAVAY
jgi:hypothetical protein